MNNENNEDLKDSTLNETTRPDNEMEMVADENSSSIEIENTEQKAEELTAEQKLQKDFDEIKDKHLRLYSEFENYKRRTAKERIELIMTSNKEVLISLLPVLDDFERAIKSMENVADVASIKIGIELVNQKLQSILISKGLKEMESIGKEFNVDLHDAITKIPAPTNDLKGKIIDAVEKGYILNDRVIRHAKVVVGE